MKLVIATTAFALTAVSAAFAGQDYAVDTISTRSVAAESYQTNRDSALNPAGTLYVTVGQERIVEASEYLAPRDKGLNYDETVSVYTFGSKSIPVASPSLR